MAVKFPQFDTRLGGGNDLWDTPAASVVLQADYFSPPAAPQTFFKTLGGIITATAVIAKGFKNEPFFGSITLSGSVSGVIKLAMAVGGSLTPAGGLRKKPLVRRLGSVTVQGGLRKKTLRRLLASIAVSGAARRKALRRLVGAITPTAIFTERTSVRVSLSGSLAPLGAVARSFIPVFVGPAKPHIRRFLTYLGR
jgi:hypothetical protein